MKLRGPVACALAVALAAAAGAKPAAAQVAKLYPVDEAADQPDLFSFRAELIQIVLRRDTAALYAVLAPDIVNSFGGDAGEAEFKDMWRPAEADSELWRTLAEVLALGGTFHGDTVFRAPYTYTLFPSEFDAFDHVVVIGSAVHIRAEPNAKAEVLATASFDILPIARDVPDNDRWEAVRLTDGRRGFIDSRHARSPIGYRVGFIRRGGRWLIRSWLRATDPWVRGGLVQLWALVRSGVDR